MSIPCVELRQLPNRRLVVSVSDDGIRIKGASDGIQTATILKEGFSTAIIYLTAHADTAMIARAKLTAPYGYLLKPVK